MARSYRYSLIKYPAPLYLFFKHDKGRLIGIGAAVAR